MLNSYNSSLRRCQHLFEDFYTMDCEAAISLAIVTGYLVRIRPRLSTGNTLYASYFTAWLDRISAGENCKPVEIESEALKLGLPTPSPDNPPYEMGMCFGKVGSFDDKRSVNVVHDDKVGMDRCISGSFNTMLLPAVSRAIGRRIVVVERTYRGIIEPNDWHFLYGLEPNILDQDISEAYYEE